jgi:hypothetical protein
MVGRTQRSERFLANKKLQLTKASPRRSSQRHRSTPSPGGIEARAPGKLSLRRGGKRTGGGTALAEIVQLAQRKSLQCRYHVFGAPAISQPKLGQQRGRPLLLPATKSAIARRSVPGRDRPERLPEQIVSEMRRILRHLILVNVVSPCWNCCLRVPFRVLPGVLKMPR